MENVYSAGENIGAPGGPLFVPGLISERINGAQFRHRCLELIEDLMDELEDLVLDDDDSDLLVNDLKVVTDAQLVNALAETDGGDLVNADNNQIVVMEPEIHPHQSVHPYSTLMYGDQSCPTIEYEDPTIESENFVLASGQIAPANSPGGSLETWGLTMTQVNLFAEATGIREVDHANLETKEDLHEDIQKFDLENALQCEINNEKADIFNTTVVKDQIAEKTEVELLKLSPKVILGNENPSLNTKKDVSSSKKKKKKKATKKDMRQLKKGKPRGRPRDREVRAAALKDANREAALVLLRRERAAARENAPLRCLHLVEKTKGAALGHAQKLQSSFLTSLPKAPGDSNPKNPSESVDPSEVLLCVEFYSSSGRLSKAQEFFVLGSQSLTALRDRLYCLTDELARHAKLEVPSGYFLIENVFYNDLRHSEATDYSRPILDWLQAGEKEVARKWKSLGGSKPQPILNDGGQPCSNDIPTFKAASMSETCFQDINCRLGERYLYCHQGNCKHSLIVRDMRLIHPEDIQNKHAYPLIRDQQSLGHRKCNICDIYRAKVVTYDDKLAPQSPCFFCQNCYYMLHYSESGMLIYDDFKVYDYFHE